MNQDNFFPEGYKVEDFSRLVRQNSASCYPKVPTGNGFCMYVRRDCINEIGPLDQVGFPVGYGEENDFCMRAIHAGFYHVMDDRTFVYHKRSASFGESKSAHYDRGRDTLRSRYPEYSKLTSVFSTSSDILSVRWRIRAAIKHRQGVEKPLPRALFVISTKTGGTPQTNEDLMRALATNLEGWVLHCDSQTISLYKKNILEENLVYKVDLRSGIAPLSHRSDEYNSIVFKILVKYGFELVDGI
jgi:hypothetical protein